MNSGSETSKTEEEKDLNPSLSFFSLPKDIVLNCIARISSSYYPKLTLVSKTFRSLVSSHELYMARFLQKSTENILYVCLHCPMYLRHHYWFTLWLKPNHTLTNDLRKNKWSSTKALLVPVPSSYCPYLPTSMCTVGSECKLPNMTLARENAIAGVLDEKIYVMGGCKGNESKNWAEVYDTNTQTWEPLPDPGVQLRYSPLKRMEGSGESIYVITNKRYEYDVYNTKEGRWEVVGRSPMFQCSCVIDNVRYCYGDRGFLWYDEKHDDWRRVKGLFLLDRHCRSGSGDIEMANYGGKLLIIWDNFVLPRHCYDKNIWCALIAFERQNGDEEVWGQVEWASIVLTVPISYVLLRHAIRSI